MKSVGEVMAIGRTFQESLQKALRGLETGVDGLDEIVDLDAEHAREDLGRDARHLHRLGPRPASPTRGPARASRRAPARGLGDDRLEHSPIIHDLIDACLFPIPLTQLYMLFIRSVDFQKIEL